GSAGGPRHALPLLTDSEFASRQASAAGRQARNSQEPAASRQPPFLIVNGDTLTDLDVAAMLASHAQTGAAVTMALIPNPRPDKYGGVTVSDDGWVKGFSRAGSGAGHH